MPAPVLAEQSFGAASRTSRTSFTPGRDRRERHEGLGALIGDEPGDGRLAGAGRARRRSPRRAGRPRRGHATPRRARAGGAGRRRRRRCAAASAQRAALAWRARPPRRRRTGRARRAGARHSGVASAGRRAWRLGPAFLLRALHDRDAELAELAPRAAAADPRSSGRRPTGSSGRRSPRGCSPRRRGWRRGDRCQTAKPPCGGAP